MPNQQRDSRAAQDVVVAVLAEDDLFTLPVKRDAVSLVHPGAPDVIGAFQLLRPETSAVSRVCAQQVKALRDLCD